MELKTVKEIKNLKGKRVLVRVDFNEPLKDGKVLNDFRIRKSLQTIEYLKKEGAKVILISHIGRDKHESLKPVSEYLKKHIEHTFVTDDPKDAIGDMNDGDIILLENLRQNKGETDNDKAFARELAGLGDVYVNEAFAVSHREHASIVGVPAFLDGYIGLEFESEINTLKKVFENPEHPFLFVLGGAKFKTKLPLLEKYLRVADTVFVGGALMNDFFKEKGFEVGRSVVDDKEYNLDQLLKNKKLTLPIDVVVEKDGETLNKKPDEVEKNEMIVDVGNETLEILKENVNQAELIVLNGPLGYYEKGFDEGTKKILSLLSKSTAKTIVGGGDTVQFVVEGGIEEKITFVSTGGGAMLDFLLKGTLPGIEALI